MGQITIAILGFGEGGNYLAKALRGLAATRVIAFDAAMAYPAAAARLELAAEHTGVEIRDEINSWLGEANIVFSLVPGMAAAEVSSAAAPVMRSGAIFCDLNSITGSMMREVAAPFESTCVRVVDGSVLGNFAGGHKVPLLLVGQGAEEVKALLPVERFIVDIIDGRIGDASTIKMLRSILMKGVEALFIECLVTAERQGVREMLLAAFKDVDERPFSKTMEIMTTTHLVHAERRMKEVGHVLSVLDAENVWNVMTRAAHKVYQNTVDAGVRPVDGKVKSLAETLAVLSAIYYSRNEV